MNNIDNTQLITSIDTKLNKRQWKFIQYINKGISVVDAYKLAGYTGTNPQSPYQLSHSLKGIVSNIAESNGFNKNRLMIELNRLVDLPLEDSKLTVSLREKLSILKVLAKCLPEMDKPKENFTRFTIVNNIVKSGDDVTHVDSTNVVDVKEIES